MQEYILCSKVFNCSPTELESIEERKLQLYREYYQQEQKHQDYLASKAKLKQR